MKTWTNKLGVVCAALCLGLVVSTGCDVEDIEDFEDIEDIESEDSEYRVSTLDEQVSFEAMAGCSACAHGTTCCCSAGAGGSCSSGVGWAECSDGKGTTECIADKFSCQCGPVDTEWSLE